MIFFKSKKIKTQTGQTLIETLAAMFILIMGVSAAVGLAIYAYGSSNAIVKQIIATGLAREGLEAVRNMRDTNWLKDTIVDNGCHNFDSSKANVADCYINWLGDSNLSVVPFCLNPTNNAGNCNGSATTKNYFLRFDNSSTNYWSLDKDDNNFGLVFNNPSSGNNWRQYGFYDPTSGGVSCVSSQSTSGYCRRIVLTKIDSFSPYDQDANYILLKVQSQVWWVDKKCPKAATYDEAPVSCKMELVSFLTNWKY